MPDRFKDLSKLNRYWALARQPRLQSGVGRGDYYEALALAEEAVSWVEREMLDRAERD